MAQLWREPTFPDSKDELIDLVRQLGELPVEHFASPLPQGLILRMVAITKQWEAEPKAV